MSNLNNELKTNLPNWVDVNDKGKMKVNTTKLGDEIMEEVPMIRASTLPKGARFDETTGKWRLDNLSDFLNVYIIDKLDSVNLWSQSKLYDVKKYIMIKIYDITDESKLLNEVMSEIDKSKDTILAYLSDPFQELVSDFLPSSFITAHYQSWCKSNALKPVTSHEFEIRLHKHLEGKFDKTNQRPHTAGFNFEADTKTAHKSQWFIELFSWNDYKHKQTTRGYRRIK